MQDCNLTLLSAYLLYIQVMSLGESLCQLAHHQERLASQGPAIEHANLIDEVQGRSAELAAAVNAAEAQLEENQKQQQESQTFKGRVQLCLQA